MISKQAVNNLIKWYEKNRRVLAWREDPTPFHVWVSEVMLQQTRVEAVRDYYARFMEEIPDVEALAQIPEERLLKLWEGLGYYSRARNLKKAAEQIMTEYGGEIPASYEELIKLPGIGAYTAGAIASIAFGAPCPAVDGNVLRVLTRLHADERDIAEEQTKRSVADALRDVYRALPKTSVPAGTLTQALMELGATVCVPNGEPHCDKCPWEKECKAHASGRETDYPVKAAKKARRIEERTVLVLQDENATLIRKRPARGLLAGLYELPSLDGHYTLAQVRKWLREQGVAALRIEQLPDAKHIFTHVEWHMCAFRVTLDTLSDFSPRVLDGILADRHEIEERYPMPGAFKAYRMYL